MSAAFNLRGVLKWTHTWMGLVAGFVVVIISLSGSVIVFRTEIQLASSARGAGGPGVAGLDTLTQQIALTKPDAQVRRVRFPAAPGEPFVVQVESDGKQERLVCDASTGRVLGALNAGFADWMVDLHRNLLAGKTGRKAVGGFGIVLFSLAGTGLCLWLIGARKWRAWVSVRAQGSSRRFHFELHRASGLWSYGLLTVLAITGIGLAYPDTFRSALQQMTGESAPRKAPRAAESGSRPLRALDRYVSAGKGAMPDAVPTELRMPETKAAPVDLRLRRPGDLSLSGNHVYLEPSSGRVLAISRESDLPLGARIFAAFRPIHYGEFGGLPTKVLWSLLGIVPALLFVAGLLTWWRPNKRKAPLEPQEGLALSGAGASASYPVSEEARVN